MNYVAMSAQQWLANAALSASALVAQSNRAALPLINAAIGTAQTVVSTSNAISAPFMKKVVQASQVLAAAHEDVAQQIGTCVASFVEEGKNLSAAATQSDGILERAIQDASTSLFNVIGSSLNPAQRNQPDLHQRNLAEFNANRAEAFDLLKNQVGTLLDSTEACWVAIEGLGNGFQGISRQVFEQLTSNATDADEPTVR
jgi:hypothetical protein